jgi:pSer/pThr/pTyr-binding forkhead associated (FHA) protein
MPHLILTHPGHESRILPLTNPFKVGRRADNDLVINDLRMSRYHIQFERTDKGWVVIDKESSSGITINDLRAGRSTVLHDGDVIYVGGIFLKFEVED